MGWVWVWDGGFSDLCLIFSFHTGDRNFCVKWRLTHMGVSIGVCIRIYVCACVYISVHMCVGMCICTFMSLCVNVSACVQNTHVSICTFLFHIGIDVCLCV